MPYLRASILAIGVAALAALYQPGAPAAPQTSAPDAGAAAVAPAAPTPAAPAPPVVSPVLADHFLVTWYGNPRSERMGVLGRHKGNALATGLRKQAAAYAKLTTKKILHAYHLVAVIAQPTPWQDKRWNRRETHATITSLLEQARANRFKLILDVQPGQSTVRAELEYLRRYLEDPDVYLALDPEFAMREGEKPGSRIGRMSAADVNDAIDFLETVVRERGLPPKVLIVHQFTMNMLRDKQNIRDSPVVDVVLSVDGFGDRPLKRAIYGAVVRQGPLEFQAIKLFYREDTNVLAEPDVMKLRPAPAMVIYQ